LHYAIIHKQQKYPSLAETRYKVKEMLSKYRPHIHNWI